MISHSSRALRHVTSLEEDVISPNQARRWTACRPARILPDFLRFSSSQYGVPCRFLQSIAATSAASSVRIITPRKNPCQTHTLMTATGRPRVHDRRTTSSQQRRTTNDERRTTNDERRKVGRPRIGYYYRLTHFTSLPIQYINSYFTVYQNSCYVRTDSYLFSLV